MRYVSNISVCGIPIILIPEWYFFRATNKKQIVKLAILYYYMCHCKYVDFTLALLLLFKQPVSVHLQLLVSRISNHKWALILNETDSSVLTYSETCWKSYDVYRYLTMTYIVRRLSNASNTNMSLNLLLDCVAFLSISVRIVKQNTGSIFLYT